MFVYQRDVLLDTGPLVSVLDAKDQWHARCAAVWPEVVHRCVTTEAVVTEACHLVLRGGAAANLPLDFLLAADIPIMSLPSGGHRRVKALMAVYASVPMDYADATLVALAEALKIRTAFTTDRRGFRSYRLTRRQPFALLPA